MFSFAVRKKVPRSVNSLFLVSSPGVYSTRFHEDRLPSALRQPFRMMCDEAQRIAMLKQQRAAALMREVSALASVQQPGLANNSLLNLAFPQMANSRNGSQLLGDSRGGYGAAKREIERPRQRP